jgi:hypothetical protein
MSALVLASFPIAALIFAAMVGIPLWLTFKRPDRAPRYTQARAYRVATAALGRRAAAPRVSVARQHMGARATVPGRQHAVPARSHAAGGRDHTPARRDQVTA